MITMQKPILGNFVFVKMITDSEDPISVLDDYERRAKERFGERRAELRLFFPHFLQQFFHSIPLSEIKPIYCL